jgi:primosomal protein N' (replication factor Y)
MPAAQAELFAAPATDAALYAQIVFDRPLDTAYTYAVPEELRHAIKIGQRVEASFGKGDRATIGYCIGFTETAPPRAVKSIVRLVDAEPLLTDPLLRLTRWMAEYYLCGWGQVLQAILPAGVRSRAGLKRRTFVRAAKTSPDPLPRLSAKQKEVVSYLRQSGDLIDPEEIMRTIPCGNAVIEAVVAKGLANKELVTIESEADSDDDHAAIQNPKPRIELNSDQGAAWGPIESAVRDGGFKPILLYGVTGSGKTELYLRAIEQVIAQGKEALVLVPEISLTPQTIERFRGRCRSIAVLHSHLGDAARGAHWRRVAAGQVQVVVGARSAVFAPTRKLGLIVIDEEHESTFKQESTPRYHARDVAVMRARLEDVPIILGSATPSLESWHNAERGAYQLLTLPVRVCEQPMPPVRVIDQRHEPPAKGPLRAITPPLERAINKAIDAGGQVILLLNRRGFSTHLHCPACGHVVQCEHCDLPLVYHQKRNALICHYCGFEAPPAQVCPNCQKSTVKYQGIGTEKLAEEVAIRFPGRTLERMDSDSMTKPGSHARVLDAFKEGKVDILLGTQMIAKGLDFPNVTLVGVVNADVGLHRPDFRAAERTFQLLAQVAGRAGRGPKGGQVLIQTFTPEHPAIALAATHDFQRFAELELGQRRPHGYPPFQRLARVIIRSRDAEAAAQYAERLAGAFRITLERRAKDERPLHVRLLGPAEAPVFRLNGFSRYHFQLQSPSSAQLHAVLREALASVRPPHGVDCTVDVDPLDMM